MRKELEQIITELENSTVTRVNEYEEGLYYGKLAAYRKALSLLPHQPLEIKSPIEIIQSFLTTEGFEKDYPTVTKDDIVDMIENYADQFRPVFTPESTDAQEAADLYMIKQGHHDNPEITRHDFIEGWNACLASRNGYTREQMKEAILKFWFWWSNNPKGTNTYQAVDEWLPDHLSSLTTSNQNT